MIKALRTQFVVADGAKARWVRRADQADDFVTTHDIEAEPQPHGTPGGVVFESSSHQRFNVQESDHAVKAHKARFAARVADAINAAEADGGFDRLVIVSPSRTLSEITGRLSQGASAKLAKTLAKDLTKKPDHELVGWLRPLEH